MYPYHNKIKQRIKNNELEGYEYLDTYKNISPCLLLQHDLSRPVSGGSSKTHEDELLQCLSLPFGACPCARGTREALVTVWGFREALGAVLEVLWVVSRPRGMLSRRSWGVL